MIEAWKSQLRKGAAELAVLAVLDKGDAFGVAILDTIESGDGVGVSEGALYPLLKRLETGGRIQSYWSEPDGAAAPRKYYRLTGEGQDALRAMRDAWTSFRQRMDEIVGASHDA
ncbi:PadR family transcriptional regulator [Marinicauda pacifica]|uniref:PadR family transcriptional regulator n=1 Tax=Marinicauda pacifica TaxID=1133559 RepID=A0A4S2H9I8_9PROT|nr:PadR family transcriptional regulator [Marinicauda pacifica]TGY92486.1 PadR family transcriptional regulator [Marinicauda pacifica]GGE49294.1 PadR family transcriptional regulator [Marinicauda pacifica]